MSGPLTPSKTNLAYSGNSSSACIPISQSQEASSFLLHCPFSVKTAQTRFVCSPSYRFGPFWRILLLNFNYQTQRTLKFKILFKITNGFLNIQGGSFYVIFQDFYACDFQIFQGAILFISFDILDVCNYILAFCYFPKYCVLLIKPGTRNRRDKELTPIGVWPCVCH